MVSAIYGVISPVLLCLSLSCVFVFSALRTSFGPPDTLPPPHWMAFYPLERKDMNHHHSISFMFTYILFSKLCPQNKRLLDCWYFCFCFYKRDSQNFAGAANLLSPTFPNLHDTLKTAGFKILKMQKKKRMIIKVKKKKTICIILMAHET